MGQPAVALSFFQRARDIRERTLGELHMDTGLLYNNMVRLPLPSRLHTPPQPLHFAFKTSSSPA
jgi:hypothetical protein